MSRIVESMQSHLRTCFICGNSIPDVRKASSVSLDRDLDVVAHDRCLKALQATYDEYESSQDNEIAGDWNGRMAQVGSSSVGRGMEGATGGVGAHHLLNRPCVVCQQQVTRGAVMRIGGVDYAAHAACKNRALELIADAMDAERLAVNRQDSVVGHAERRSLMNWLTRLMHE